MDKSQDKFAQLSPVLELVYVMLTNMSKYMDVYATDIEADKTEQYKEAKDALTNAIRKFDALYGLKSPASAEAVTETAEVASQAFDAIEPSAEEAPTEAVSQPGYDFASGSDPESLKKAKQAVEELKTLFSEVKKEEAAAPPAPQVESVPTSQPETVAATPAMPTFVSPEVTPVQQPMPMPAEQQMTAPATTLPTPTNTQPEGQEGGEIDSILSELKKLQNKGSGQL